MGNEAAATDRNQFSTLPKCANPSLPFIGGRPIPKLCHTELDQRLLRINDCQFVGITALTTPDMTKKGNPLFGQVVKIARVGGPINWVYSSSVNRQRIRENKAAHFKAYRRTWGHRVAHTPLVFHVNDLGEQHLYLELKLESRTQGFFHRETGERIEWADLRRWLKNKRPSRQDLDKEVVLRDYRTDHISEVRIGGDEWRVGPLWFEQQFYLPNLKESA